MLLAQFERRERVMRIWTGCFQVKWCHSLLQQTWTKLRVESKHDLSDDFMTNQTKSQLNNRHVILNLRMNATISDLLITTNNIEPLFYNPLCILPSAVPPRLFIYSLVDLWHKCLCLECVNMQVNVLISHLFITQ